ncbi:hypothetical protein [Paenibacillus mucilaginosus]|uniref:Uncharacterized protein n=2 Tax=Paenibacillus mucilaginosus TaxID=61624 RepID=H6N8V8_9BACL|nr:hypothetical protein [Paenibacillus mucilaginosus]AEI39439.1 hypothetical protein KNP414_00849 [Paenibacillus mucilaginosus KNP414]AFC27704.1 hypothetical protein PM3016_746 [Paenibacillus mucilaginosus 3016]MCG7214727.1 hypothetical protein [Paenibacillus mucilaginosus]WDM28413.1 hypothetical protein KCX80_03995 [Paenibacillus mucilaginosus]WFA16583.1 hypothetical protein ERY13_04015 [Paenibacillus mucilaginosus]
MNSTPQDRAVLEEQARRTLALNPDVVFGEVMTMEIAPEDAPLWLRFTSEWGGALYLLDETNAKRHERGMIGDEAFEYNRRTYRLGLITLSGLYDRLKGWQEGEGKVRPFAFAMNSLDCYFVPAYLADYSRVHEAGKEVCDAFIAEVMHRLDGGDEVRKEFEALDVLVGEYVRGIHLYARGQ